MISHDGGVFRLSTADTSYWFRVTKFGHLEHVYYGLRIPAQDPDALAVKHSIQAAASVLYDESDNTYCLDNLCLEWSGLGSGDYRQTPFEAAMPDGSFSHDFRFESFRIEPGAAEMQSLPSAYGTDDACETLFVVLKDASTDVYLTLVYTVFEQENVIARRVIVENRADQPCRLKRVMSLSLDLPNRGDTLVTFDGNWAREAHRHDRKLQYGMFVNQSVTGGSSNRHNPGFLLAEDGAGEEHGSVFGFNLLYSGNHFGAVELASNDLVRVQLGIHPQNFEWTLQKNERFETPQAVMTFSAGGFNGMSRNFHDFVNRRIVRGDWQGKERPIVLNSWEACFFRFTRSKLLRLARQAKKLGIELFVLDDGWFGKRNNDRAGLGDYNVNLKKLPRGLAHFSKEVASLGLRFGLWFEPEMVNPDSDLYRAHPEYALRTPGRANLLGRHQLVLDLTNPAVRDYIVSQVGRILDEADISYVKWDMNRHISDAFSPTLSEQGRFYHSYMLGLYDILNRVFRPRPQILLESCSSGGNRFDLGMLCYSPQIWTSDDTDPVERLAIQGGISYLYPLSSMGAHVSMAPHQQTLRDTPLSTRFNVSAFGCLGYELDLSLLSPAEKRIVRAQTARYRELRAVLQYGRFYRFAPKPNQRCWLCVSEDQSTAVAGFFQEQSHAWEGCDVLPLAGLDPDATYRVQSVPQFVAVKRIGGLAKHLLPFAPKPDGLLLRLANRFYALPDGLETYRATGRALMRGLPLANQFIGTGYNKQIRLLGDFGSTLYVIKRDEEKQA